MEQTTPLDETDDSTRRALRARESRLVQHDAFGGCGERIDPPCGDFSWRPYRPAERLRNRDTVCHACGKRYRPWELPQAHCGRRTPA